MLHPVLPAHRLPHEVQGAKAKKKQACVQQYLDQKNQKALAKAKSVQAAKPRHRKRRKRPRPRVKLISYPLDAGKIIAPDDVGGYRDLSPQSRMINTSMKFIPGFKNEPRGIDPFYLFNAKPPKTLHYATPMYYRNLQRRVARLPGQCLPVRPSSPVPTEIEVPILSLQCPAKNAGSLIHRAHQEFVMSYINYFNHIADPDYNVCDDYDDGSDDEEEGDDDKKLSISCALARPPTCRLPRLPKVTEYSAEETERWEPSPGFRGPIAMFPDIDTLYGGPLPVGTGAGWIDGHGGFHLAELGDLASSNAVIGWMDRKKLFHPIMSVREGIERGIIALHDRDITGQYLGDRSLAFGPHLVGYYDDSGTLYHRTQGTNFGYVDGSDEFRELGHQEPVPPNSLRAFRHQDGAVALMSRHQRPRDEIETPANLKSGHFTDVTGQFFELNPREDVPRGGTRAFNSKYDEVILLALPPGDGGWLDRIPDDVIGGYIDQFGIFHPLKRGEKIPPGGIPAYMTSDGQVIPLGLFQRAPPGSIPGYLDENGVFHELKEGESLPPGARLVYKTTDGKIIRAGAEDVPMDAILGYYKDGLFFELQIGEEIPPGAIPVYKIPDGRIFIQKGAMSVIPKGATLGYLDASEEFHELREGDELPPDAILVYRTADGVIKHIGKVPPPGGSVAGWVDPVTGEFHVLQPGESIPPGGIPAFRDPSGRILRYNSNGELDIHGYVDENGVFHELRDGDKLPSGATLASLSPSGKITKAKRVEPPPGSVAGWIDPVTGEFHVLKPGQSIPPGGIAAVRDPSGRILRYLPDGTLAIHGYVDEDGNFHELYDGEKLPRGATMSYLGSDGTVVSVTKSPLPEGSVAGWIDPITGEFHVLKPGESVPAGAISAFLGPDGKILHYLADGRLVVHGYVDAYGDFHALREGERLPPGATIAYQTDDGQVGFFRRSSLPPGSVAGWIDPMTGEFHILKPGEKIPPGGLPAILSPDGRILRQAADGTLTVHGYVDENGVFHELREGEKMPPRGVMAHLLADGSIVRDLHQKPNVARIGYFDENGIFHELQPGEVTPSGAILGVLHPDGSFSPIPPDTEIGYFDKDGNFVVLKPGEAPPPGAILGYRSADGTVTPIASPQGGKVGYFDENGVYHELEPGQALPPGATLAPKLPPGTRRAYIDADGNMHYLEDGQIPPPGAIMGYVDADGKFLVSREFGGEESDLGKELSESEKTALDKFMRHFGVEVELEKYEGSLDLGDVWRRTFRVYERGGYDTDSDLDLEVDGEQD